jgi:hypothetical protein
VVLRELRGDTLPAITSAVIAELDTIARMLYPAWLEGGERIEGKGAAARAAVHILASRQARESRDHAHFLSDLADRALTGASYQGRLVDDVRIEALLNAIRRSYQRPKAALLVGVAADTSRSRRAALFAAAQWISAHGHAGVWLVGDGDTPEHISNYQISLRPPSTDVPHGADVAPVDLPPVVFPALSGRPHPNSPTEQLLEEKLESLPWAANRHWNYPLQLSPLSNPIKLDLIWLDEKCVVEIDGDEHRLRRNYDADRRRDARLLLQGYVVLRFTNHRIYHDLASTLHTIERLLQNRRLS